MTKGFVTCRANNDDWQVSIYNHSSRTKEIKEDSHISFKDLDMLYHLLPSNTLALGLYELSINYFFKILFDTPQAFAASKKKKEDIYREETTFCNS